MLVEQLPTQPLHVIRQELRRRRAHLVPHRTQSLEQHLFNTFDILTAWQQPPRVRYAGLVHSVYSTDVFGHRTFDMNEREQVCELVGEMAERLTYLFCAIDRRELLSVLRASAHEITDTFTLSSRLGGHPVQVTGADAGDLLAIYMANAAEQSCQPDRSPARWLSYVSLLGRDVRRLVRVAPPIFDGCATTVSSTEEAQLIAGYQRLVARIGNVDEKIDELNERGGARLGDWPFVGEPLVWMGFHAIGHRKSEDAAALGRAAAARLQHLGTPWDKRLPVRHWLQLTAALCNSTRADELAFVAQRIAAAAESGSPTPERLYIELARTGLVSAEDRAGMGTSSLMQSIASGENLRASAGPDVAAEPALPARFQTYIARLRSNHETPTMTKYPDLQSIPWHDPKQFRLVGDLEANAAEVAAEIRAFAGRGFQDEAENIERSGRWSVLFLYERGRKNEYNCSRCPQTTAIIEANRTVLSLGGLAYFSVLDPNTHVAAHNAATNMRLRCHLGIDVPDGCGMRVDGITHTWEEGRCVVFDDSFTHEVWNRGTRPRIVLVVDLWHPDLTDDEVALLNGLHRYATATGTRLVRYWDRNRAKTGDTSHGQSPQRPQPSRHQLLPPKFSRFRL